MWIMTQGKKGLVNLDECGSVCVTANIGKKKSCIIVYPTNTILGYYDSEKNAIDELENIAQEMQKGNKFYYMP